MAKKLDLKKINSKFPDNFCILTFDMSDFPCLLSKLNDTWEQISMPEQKEDENVKWIIATSKYYIDKEVRYLLFCFGNVKDTDILEEIKTLDD